MSVRRLAVVQPESFAWSPESRAKADWWIAKYPQGRERSAVIPLLWLVQKQEGWVCEPAMRLIAECLDMPYIRVYEVATFYTMFNLAPVGAHHVQLCGTTPCMLRGSEELKAVCRDAIGPQMTPSADGRLSWVEVECLGACCNAPMVQVSNAEGDHYFEDLDRETFTKLLNDLRAGRPVKPGPQNGRRASEPQDAIKTLQDPALYDGSLAKPIVLPNRLGAEAKG